MRRLIAILGLSLLLASCATAQKLGAARDVHSLLVAIRDDDTAAFEAHVDRPALTREIEYRMAHELQASKTDSRLKMLGVLLGPTVAQVAGDVLIQPGTFRMVAASYGYQPSQPLPGPMVIAQALRPLDDGRVCTVAKKDGPCVLVFSQRPGTGAWRLSGFEGDLSMLKRPF
jgi:predicted small secreted protein